MRIYRDPNTTGPRPMHPYGPNMPPCNAPDCKYCLNLRRKMVEEGKDPDEDTPGE